MPRWLSIAVIIASAAASDVLTIGTEELSSGEPFCCS